AGRILGGRRRSDAGARRGAHLDARDARTGDAAPAVSRDVGRLFCVRPQPRFSDDASADLSRDLRSGPDAERRGLGGHRRHELRRLLGGRLARRALPKHILLGLLYILRAGVFTAYFMMPPTPASTLVFAAAMGMLWLSVAPLVTGLVAEMFGTRYMATLLGISFVLHQVGSSLGAFGGGLIF